MLEMPCNSKNLTSYHCACTRDLHGNVMYLIRMFNFMYLSLFLDMFPPLDPRCPLVNKMSPHIYTTYISGIFSLGGGGGNRVVDAKEDNIQLKTLTSGGKYSVLKYTAASTVQIYKILSCRRG